MVLYALPWSRDVDATIELLGVFKGHLDITIIQPTHAHLKSNRFSLLGFLGGVDLEELEIALRPHVIG